MRCFNGIQVEPDSDGGVFLHQQRFARELLDEFGFSDATPRRVPLDDHCAPLPRAVDEPECSVGITRYQQAVGSLLYLLPTRPDLQYAVSLCARFMSRPAEHHWTMVCSILRYVSSTVELGLHYRRSSSISPPVFSAYSDADWAGSRSDRKSTSGYVVYWGTCLISASSAKQNSVALSTCESEFISATRCAQELLSLRQLLSELLGAPPVSGIRLFLDNKSAIDFTLNAITNQRSKHIDIKYFFLRDLVQSGVMVPEYIPTAHMIADSCTKPLRACKFLEGRAQLGVVPVAVAPVPLLTPLAPAPQ